MAREIQHIPARREAVNRAAVRERKIKLAAYCRVSTNNEDQLLSFDNQVTYYRDYATRHPEYDLLEIYADASDIVEPSQEVLAAQGFSGLVHFLRPLFGRL